MFLKKTEISRFVRAASELSVGAGKILKRGFNRALRIDYKGRINPVTEYDIKSERYITSRITKWFPDHDILAEESGATVEKSPFRWIIDPLDGTVNYAHGFPFYCVSVALEHEGEMVAGAVYDPERDELFYAGAGMGAFLNKTRIKVTSERVLRRALLATGFAYNIGTARRTNLGLFARMAKKAQGLRRPGSAAIDLCWLACGRIDGFWEFYLHPWDTAAAKLIVEEAGGKVSRINGKAYSIFDPDILASNGRLHKVMMSTLTGRTL
ncbi:MAG: inositol monophosphatase family protein [Candidatus Zixiibacteriota bacterium]